MTDQRHSLQGLPEFHLHGPTQQSRSKVVRTARLVAVVVIVLLLLGLCRALLARRANAEMLASRAAENAILQVRVVQPSAASGHESKLTLPSALQGIYEAQIYARTTGYVKQWFKDIGQPVKRGDLLATLDIPDVNKQVEEAQANFELAKIAYERWSRLREIDAVSQQDYDEKAAAYQQTEAVLKRLRDQQSFGNVLAPFDGIVTRRNIDNGDLVNAGNGGINQVMFAIAQNDRLRLYAYVPQNRAARIRVGDSVDILRSEAAEKPIKGRIVHSAGAIDPTTRTLQIEIQVPNADHSLLPGAYVDVALTLKSDGGLILPTNTLLFSAAGSRVAIIQPDGKVRLQSVTLGTDYGHEVEIKSGLKSEDKVIMNPPDSISDGQSAVIAAEVQKGS
ncbi:MAG: efflux RND transporter periplasmic adaptor subunit [Gallionellaceae bacterium]